ncbi:MAG: hypothetical protein WC869_08200 [Phycisphaerae bacterium]|jgi:hypothetical protein
MPKKKPINLRRRSVKWPEFIPKYKALLLVSGMSDAQTCRLLGIRGPLGRANDRSGPTDGLLLHGCAVFRLALNDWKLPMPGFMQALVLRWAYARAIDDGHIGVVDTFWQA